MMVGRNPSSQILLPTPGMTWTIMRKRLTGPGGTLYLLSIGEEEDEPEYSTNL